ncbi:phosphoribosylformylglycinamidine synthase subunit PurQ [Candidatus Bathyarchaeota archaeon]|nr:MAG: phosphoribosylformylglycinamidine synthase subunit PurQ [Candidatus Bathyarchaeota archaeon]HDM88505.1 phosphoribosylformylglycinamidine synthase subunit PurQ [Candidatus Bathyarchaeota archaeon]
MRVSDARICIIRVGGTNCDRETKRSIEELGAKADVWHLSMLVKKKALHKYYGLVIPGGFSFGDYVRAGAILAKSLTVKLGAELERFIDEGKPILGICNGFQVLVESGLLPGFDGVSKYPEAALATNIPIGYRCRWVYLRHENSGKCIFTSEIPRGKVLRIPIAHAEGRFIFPKDIERRLLDRLIENDQLVFRYCSEDGSPANGRYPDNPNGSFYDIAGICDSSGKIFGLMPHPERAFYGWQLPDWTRMEKPPEFADGKTIFSSMIEYITRRF